MNTSSVELGSLLSLAAREPAATLNSKRNQRVALQQPRDGIAGNRSEQTPKTDSKVHTQRAQLKEVLDSVARLDQRLSFRVDESSGKSVVVISDARTSEVLKQFPSEEMLTVARRLEEHLQQFGNAAGVLHTDEA